MIKKLLGHPLARDVDLDDPELASIRLKIIKDKPFIRSIYEEWYLFILNNLPPGSGRVLELGAGGGFMKDLLPDVISSEILLCPHVDSVLDATKLPFKDGSLKGIVMTNVLHHIADVSSFLREASRCIKKDGVIVMIEPWVIGWWPWFIYKYVHHEPCDLNTKRWDFPPSGPLSNANIALPWIVFERDVEIFKREFDEWRLNEIEFDMPISFLLAGGVSMRNFMPGWIYSPVRIMEKAIVSIKKNEAMFARIVLTKSY